MEIKMGTHRRFTEAEKIALSAVLTDYSCTDRCDRAEVLKLREEIVYTNMFEINDNNKCIITRAIKYELKELGQIKETPKVRRYKEMLAWIIQKTNQ
ncbi:MAG: hypothetical protein ACRCX2_20155 [Paraclostridium sp.]